MTCPKGSAPDNTIVWPITFVSKSLTSAEHRYTNIEREASGILHGLKKFYHYCFARDLRVITEYKPMVAIFQKRHSNPVTKNSVYTSENKPIHG